MVFLASKTIQKKKLLPPFLESSFDSSRGMSFKHIVRELREMRDGIGSMSRRRVGERKHWQSNRTMSHISPDSGSTTARDRVVQQGRWADLPPELLLDIIERVEESEVSWPARKSVVFCGSVCKSWRDVTREVVKTPEECGRLTFPVSLKQPGPRENPMQCFIKRDSATSAFYLYFGLVPGESVRDKKLLAAKRIRRATSTEFIISLVGDDFSRASSTYVGKLKSNFLGTKFTIYDSQPTSDSMIQPNSRSSRRFSSKQVSPRVSACTYNVGTVSYELNLLRSRGPRRMQCVMNSIPVSSIQEGGTAPTPTSLPQVYDEQFSSLLGLKDKNLGKEFNSTPVLQSPLPSDPGAEPLALKNKFPRWHEQLQCWCLNFRGRVTVASVKNFQLVAAVDPSHNVSAEQQERVILQFGKIGKDIFALDYSYPLSCFQAFAICLSTFDTKPACE